VPAKRKGGFFATNARPEDEAARQRDVEALMVERRTIPQEIAIDHIVPNPFQARTTFDGLEELADAIRQQGFVSRLRVRPDPARPNSFQLVFGERRLRAAALAGLDTVPCDVAEHTDDELIEIGLAENIQRRDLDPLEEARALQTFLDGRGYSIRRLAERIGKDKSYIEDRLKLLQAPLDVQQMVAARPDTLRAAREIAKLATPAQRAPVIAGVVEGQLSTEGVRAAVRAASRVLSAPTATNGAAPAAQQAAQVRSEAQTVQAILAHWRTLLAQGDAERTLVAEQIEVVLREINGVVQLLEQ